MNDERWTMNDEQSIVNRYEKWQTRPEDRKVVDTVVFQQLQQKICQERAISLLILVVSFDVSVIMSRRFTFAWTESNIDAIYNGSLIYKYHI
jgi:hypothetical protein